MTVGQTEYLWNEDDGTNGT